MSEKELINQVLSEVRYIKERQDDFIDQVHGWRIEASEVHADQELHISKLQNQMNGFVWMAGKVALAAAALLHGAAAVVWLVVKSWLQG